MRVNWIFILDLLILDFRFTFFRFLFSPHEQLSKDSINVKSNLDHLAIEAV